MAVRLDKSGWDRAKKKLLQEMTKPDSRYMANINNIIVGKIISRTKSGVDIGGMRFKPYSEKYKKKKKSSTVNLKLSGQMLSSGSFKYQTIFQGGRVMIRIWMEGGHGKISTGFLASVHNFGEGNMPKREFFGIDKKITDAIKKLSTDKWREIMRSLS